jgi:hypothetical protein
MDLLNYNPMSIVFRKIRIHAFAFTQQANDPVNFSVDRKAAVHFLIIHLVPSPPRMVVSNLLPVLYFKNLDFTGDSNKKSIDLPFLV